MTHGLGLSTQPAGPDEPGAPSETGEWGGPGGPLSASPAPLVDVHDAALMDLDGVVYRGSEAVPHAAPAIAAARGRGMRTVFVTNNALRTPARVAERLRSFGVLAAPADVVTSAQAAARLLAGRLPRGAAVLVAGGEGLREAVRDVGLRPVTTAGEGPAAVVQGFDPAIGYARLAEAALAIQAGALWVASNTDASVPTERGLLPGNGSLVAMLRTATGAVPLVAGKPERALHEESVRRAGARSPLIVGDRLDTDIASAVRSGTPSLLVLTGVTGKGELLRAGAHYRPTYVAADLRGLFVRHPGTRLSVSAAGDGATAGPADEAWPDRVPDRVPDEVEAFCGRWAARVRAGTLTWRRVRPAGRPADRSEAVRITDGDSPGRGGRESPSGSASPRDAVWAREGVR
ncbi:HAD-IIA family hydrolase, partial [Frankia sp. CiP1_Cm_nod1]|uniref:HAD-IIA family hydrolase n=1 Tax=Frankia sp. CiP1_Cm_nod1 TaxID=2897160 RepID=UPI0020259295